MKNPLLIVVTFVAFHLMAQEHTMYSVKGRIMDEAEEPLPFAYVGIDSLNKKVITDIQGYYELKDIPVGTHRVTVQMMGFKEYSQTILVEGKSLTQVNFILNQDVQMLNEIVISVESEKTIIEKEAKAVTIIDTKVDQQKTADLGEVLSRSEGVSVQRAGGLGSNMRFSLNGLTDDQIRFFVDDVPLEFSPYSLGLANIPVNLIKRLEIYKGVLPIQFGADALGGGVNVVSNAVKSGFHTDASYQVGSFNTHRTTLSMSYSYKKAFVRVNGFYDYSANNYEVDVQIANELGKLEEVTTKRFHDDYRGFGSNITSGVRDTKIIDELSLTVFYNDLYKEVQHNNVMSGSPYGFVYRKRNSVGAIGKANFKLSEKWVLRNNFGYSRNEREFTDTSANVFNWLGDIVVRRNSSVLGEIQASNKSRLFLWDRNYFWRNVTSYQLTKATQLSLSSAPTYNSRTGDELFSGSFDPATTNSKLLTWVNSLALNYKKEKWENNLFVKHYIQQGKSEEPLPADLGSKTVNRNEQLWGAGNVFIYKVTKQLWFKPSYEYAIRLPRPDEIFGDGAFTADNLKLNPENSHNFNFQIDYKPNSSKIDWAFQSNVFGRIINDLILLIPNNDRSAVYDNVFSANSYGVELGGKTKLLENKLGLSANTTMQHFYNNSTEGHFSRFNGDRIPNRPYYFANVAADYTFKDVFSKKDKLLLFWQLRYTHAYFLTWESLGSVNSKAVIPNQTLQSAGISYQQRIGKTAVNLSLEVQNLTNQKAFDFFGVQRPGRAVYMKIVINI